MRKISKSLLIFFLLVHLIGYNLNIYPQTDSKSVVKIINDSELKQILEREKGSALLINVWATWCVPCREEYPDLVKLSENYKNRIKIIGISADDIDELDTKVVPFLKDQNAKFENYLIKVVDPEDFINVLNKDWSGALPATFFYDKNGKQLVALIGKKTYDDFDKAIKKVID